MPSDQSQIFKNNYKCWSFFGIWGGRKPSKYYKCYAFIYLLITCISFNVLLTLNLIYTPRKLEFVLREIIFYFTEMSIVSKVFTIILIRHKIIEALDIIDSDEFVGDYENKDGILFKLNKNFKFCWKFYASFSHIAFSSQMLLPPVFGLIRGKRTALPISEYYFLSDETRNSYYFFWLVYQSYGMYGHMMYNVNIDTFIVGLLAISVAQLRLLNANLRNLKLSEDETKLPKELQDKMLIARLHSYLRHYDTIIKYNSTVEDIISTTMFVQFSLGSLITCVGVSGLLLLPSTSMRVFLVLFLCVRTTQIFLPAYFGTQLAYESQELVFAAYNTEWIPRSEAFKRSLRLFMERAKIPLKITCLKMLPLSLLTFTSIMKMAYSFFTLINHFQEEKK